MKRYLSALGPGPNVQRPAPERLTQRFSALPRRTVRVGTSGERPRKSVEALWQIEMLGGLRAVHEERIVSRFRSRQTASLLAYLACYRHRSHPREALTELLWPEYDPAAGRLSRLRCLALRVPLAK